VPCLFFSFECYAYSLCRNVCISWRSDGCILFCTSTLRFLSFKEEYLASRNIRCSTTIPVRFKTCCSYWFLNCKPRFSLIPLTIFYSSLTKLFLLFLLTIWRPSASKPGGSPYYWDPSYYSSPIVSRALEIWDEDKLDREWVVRNVLGGMATGFGLRGLLWSVFFRIRTSLNNSLAVVLDCHPVFTTVVILVGWLAKTVVAGFLKNWVGGDEHSGDKWMAHSIP